MPWGRRDPGESRLECAVRETFEETSLVVDPDKAEPIRMGVLLAIWSCKNVQTGTNSPVLLNSRKIDSMQPLIGKHSPELIC